MGKVYRSRPQSVVVQCDCGENQTLTAAFKHACEECGADHRSVVEEELEARPDEDEERFDHPGVHNALTTHLPGDLELRDRGGKDGARAKGTGAFKYEGTLQQISSIEAVALGPMLRAQAPKRGSGSVYPSRRRLRGSLPVLCGTTGPVRGNGEDARHVLLEQLVLNEQQPSPGGYFAPIHKPPRGGDLLGNSLGR